MRDAVPTPEYAVTVRSSLLLKSEPVAPVARTRLLASAQITVEVPSVLRHVIETAVGKFREEYGVSLTILGSDTSRKLDSVVINGLTEELEAARDRLSEVCKVCNFELVQGLHDAPVNGLCCCCC